MAASLASPCKLRMTEPKECFAAKASGNRREIEGYLIASKETDLDNWLGSVLVLSLSLRSSASAEQIMSHFHIKE